VKPKLYIQYKEEKNLFFTEGRTEVIVTKSPKFRSKKFIVSVLSDD
jgi:hypothetical protein